MKRALLFVALAAGIPATAQVIPSVSDCATNPSCIVARREDRGVTKDEMVAGFERVLRTALKRMGVETDVRIAQREAIPTVAQTAWLRAADGTAYYQVSVASRHLVKMIPDERAHAAIHEACHVAKHGKALEQDAPLSAEERAMLEMDAERCVMMYLAMSSAMGWPLEDK